MGNYVVARDGENNLWIQSTCVARATMPGKQTINAARQEKLRILLLLDIGMPSSRGRRGDTRAQQVHFTGGDVGRGPDGAIENG